MVTLIMMMVVLVRQQELWGWGGGSWPVSVDSPRSFSCPDMRVRAETSEH